MNTKLYDEERDTDDYHDIVMKHMSAMTTENLHSKAAIAAELAFRDSRIAELEQCARYESDVAEQAIQRMKELEQALGDLIEVAQRCDGWESFPQKALDDANKVLVDK